MRIEHTRGNGAKLPCRPFLDRIGLGCLIALSACSAPERATPLPLCRAHEQQGGVNIAGDTASCPIITYYSASPARTEVGRDVVLTSAALDPDGTDISFSWNATAGELSNPAAAATTYRCTVPGTIAITLTISDGSCGDSQTISVFCDPGSCGDGGGADGADCAGT